MSIANYVLSIKRAFGFEIHLGGDEGKLHTAIAAKDVFCDGRKTTQRHPGWRGLRRGPEGGICDTSTEAQSRHLVAYWSVPSLRFFTLDIFFTSISRRLADARSRYGSAW